MSKIAHPHDRFLKILLSDPERAACLLRERLPVEISELLSDELPELVVGSFVDQELQEYLTDRLFRVRTVHGQEAFLYALVDHKSYPDGFVAWQLLRYMVRALEQWEREHPKWKRLPAIVPLVVYHGADKWRIPNSFLALVDAPIGWKTYLLDFKFSLFDLGHVEDHQLSKQPYLRAWLLAAKYATRDGKQLEIKDFLVEVLTEVPADDFMVIMRYVVETYRHYDEKDVREIIRRVRPEEEEKMMSQFAQSVIENTNPKWAQMVRQEGEQRGEQRGEAKMLTRQLQRRFGTVPDWAREKISKAELASLENWSLRIFDAQSLDDVFSDKV
ncbi:MAG: Rpn family recombination-promoting nuclease/putative transposase [Magnetococcales bacterium]|nr:Rpn family recombination-promoting nuclease/putative transposase [Magnetococcales bacterium]MBF0150091.1 Rpn family recombination-promoting nuclease/putative transposase [Magnetococcales bacterium]